jgi:hypothetical protein
MIKSLTKKPFINLGGYIYPHPPPRVWVFYAPIGHKKIPYVGFLFFSYRSIMVSMSSSVKLQPLQYISNFLF